MQHIDEAGLHEYLDRGAVDPAMRNVADHIATCAACQAKLRLAESDRDAASNILRAAAPSGMPMPAFDTIMPRPKYETLDAGFNTDLAAFSPGAQYKQSSIGMRGQAIAFAWAATIVMAIGAGWFANQLYREANKIAPIAANTDTSSTVPAGAGPAVPVMTSSSPETSAPGAVARNTVAKRSDQVASRNDADSRVAASRVAAKEAPPVAQPTGGLAVAERATAQNADAAAVAAAPVAVAMAPAPAPPPSISANRSAGAVSSKTRFAESAVSPSSDIILSARMLSDSSWRSISGDAARKALGGTVVRLHSMKVVGYSESADSMPQRIRMRQVSVTGDTIDIIQTRPKSLLSGPSNPVGKPPALLARVVVEGATGKLYYETLKWSDERLVTLIAKDAETLQALKKDLLGER